MRRRRLRIQQIQHVQRTQDEPPEKLRARATTVNHAQAEASGINAASALRPAQLRLLDLQQQIGNQGALRIMRVMRAARAEDAQDPRTDQAQDQGAAQADLGEVVNTGGEVQGVNDKTDLRSLMAAAITAYKSHKYGMALTAFRELFSFQPSAAGLVNIAICEIRLDRFTEAITALEEALDASDLTDVDRKRAIAAMDGAQKLEAAEAVGFVPLPKNVDTDSSPTAKEPRALRNQIRTLYESAEGAAKSEDYETALKTFRLAQKRLPNPINLLNVGKCLVMLRRYSDAATAFDMALRDRTLNGGVRKMTEAELQTVRYFMGMSLDRFGDLPPEG